MDDRQIVDRLLELAEDNVASGGWPFSTIITHNGKIIAEAINRVHSTHDPSSHAEIEAIRVASSKLGRANLEDCNIYMIAPPCPMCLTCMLLSKIKNIHCILDIEQKDKALTKLPLTQDLYEFVQAKSQSFYTEITYHGEDSEKAASVLERWNNAQA